MRRKSSWKVRTVNGESSERISWKSVYHKIKDKGRIGNRYALQKTMRGKWD